MSIWLKYFALFILGVVIALASPKQQLIESLSILGPISLTALFASLLVPFAGLSSNERVQKYFLQFAIVPLFGFYAVLVWYKSHAGGLCLFCSAAGVHVAYWTTSFHSRQYRLEQCRLAFMHMPCLAQIVSQLNGTGQSHIADEDIIIPMLKGYSPDFQRARKLLHTSNKLIDSAAAELIRVAAQFD